MTRARLARLAGTLGVFACIAAACAGDESTTPNSAGTSATTVAPGGSTPADPATSPTSSTSPTSPTSSAESATTSATSTTTTAPPATAAPTTTIGSGGNENEPASVREIVEALADDALEGRDNNTAGSKLAQELLIDELIKFADPVTADGNTADRTDRTAYLHAFDGGANIIAVIPGDDRADEYVLIGAHYDHIGTLSARCRASDDPQDSICNGAADNATGVAAAIEVARTLAADGPPSRTIVLGLWDREEDGLLGAAAYVANPAFPLAKSVAYINFDIQGTALLPSLRNTTVAVGAETGGPQFVEAARRAAESSTLDTLFLSLLFGQGRSDHAVFVGAGVPSIFYTDANNGCYHKANDDLRNIDFDKLDQQIAAVTALAIEVTATDQPPLFDPAAPPTTYEDAVSMLAVVERGRPDLALMPAAQAATLEQFLTDLKTIVDAGEAAFDDTAVATLLGGSIVLVDALTAVNCEVIHPD